MESKQVAQTAGGFVYIVPALLVIGLYALYRQLLPRPLPGITYNATSASTLLGDAPDMMRTLKATGEFGPWCAAQIQKAGAPLCQVFVHPFSKPWVLLADFPEGYDILARRTAPSRDPDFDKSSIILGSMQCLGNFHAAQGAETFKGSRALVHDLMTPSFLHGVTGPSIHSKAVELVNLLDAKMELAAGRPFDIKADLDCVAMDVMLQFGFAENYSRTCLRLQMELISGLTPSSVPQGNMNEPVMFPEAPIEPFIAAVRDAPGVIEALINSILPQFNFWLWKKQAWYKEIFAQRDKVLREQFVKAIKTYRNGQARCATEHMLAREEREAEKQGRSPELEADILINELFGQMIAGNHTTGGALGWVTKYLTSYPHLQSKVRENLYGALPEALAEGRFPTFEELRRARLPYLDAFIEETLRLNAVPVTREAIRDTTILGRHIPKGCQVIIISNGPGFVLPPLPVSVSASDRTAGMRQTKVNDHWDESRDLRAFDPERWLVRNGEGDADLAFHSAAGPQLVFGHGVRGCWGKKLAQMEVRTVVALLVWHFELLQIPESLTGNGATEGVARRPHHAFVRLRKIIPTRGIKGGLA